MKMTTFKHTRRAFALIAAGLTGGTLAAAQTPYNRDQARMFLKAFVQANAGNGIGAAGAVSGSSGSSGKMAGRPTRHFRQAGRNIVLITHPSILFDGAPIIFRNRPFEKDGVTWVPIREFATWLNSQFHLGLVVDWNGSEVVLRQNKPAASTTSTSPPTATTPLATDDGQAEMMQGLYALWQGRVTEAHGLFKLSAAAGNEDGRAFQEWVGTPGSRQVGVLRIRRSDTARDIKAYLDGVELDPAAFLFLVDAGEHTLRIEANGAVKRQGRVQIEEEKSFVCVLQ